MQILTIPTTENQTKIMNLISPISSNKLIFISPQKNPHFTTQQKKKKKPNKPKNNNMLHSHSLLTTPKQQLEIRKSKNYPKTRQKQGFWT